MFSLTGGSFVCRFYVCERIIRVTIGVLTTGPRSQKACYDVHLTPNYYTYSIPTSELTILGPRERQGSPKSHYPANRYITPTLTPPWPRIFWVVPEGFEHWIVHHCDDVIISGVTPDTNVTIGVLTTGPRSQKACYDVHLTPNYL
jgi:hypothetical protein